jgi:hypothetical protein
MKSAWQYLVIAFEIAWAVSCIALPILRIFHVIGWNWFYCLLPILLLFTFIAIVVIWMWEEAQHGRWN